MTEHQGPEAGQPAGWYPHPTMAQTQRYWDGTTWTGEVAPVAPPAKQEQPTGWWADVTAMIQTTTWLRFVLLFAALFVVLAIVNALND